MALQEHVELARRGAAAIAEWRERNPGGRLDLSEADLSGADLTKAPLRDATLLAADLSRAVLRRADLRGADLGWAQLGGADLSDAVLDGACLRGASMRQAAFDGASVAWVDATDADMAGASFRGASLVGTRMRRAVLHGTLFGDANLWRADLASARPRVVAAVISLQHNYSWMWIVAIALATTAAYSALVPGEPALLAWLSGSITAVLIVLLLAAHGTQLAARWIAARAERRTDEELEQIARHLRIPRLRAGEFERARGGEPSVLLNALGDWLRTGSPAGSTTAVVDRLARVANVPALVVGAVARMEGAARGVVVRTASSVTRFAAPPPPRRPVRAPRRDRIQRVWYATNRMPREGAPGEFLGRRQEEEHLHFGVCRVLVPASHRRGELRSSYWFGEIRFEDDRLRIVDRAVHDGGEFWAALSAAVGEHPDGCRNGLVFVHGYRTTFDAAILRAAQLAADLDIGGEVAAFSWPSRGTLLGYWPDEAAVHVSRVHFMRFLQRFVRESGADRVHVIAHSMGNRCLLRAVRELRGQPTQGQVRFGQVFLAAPDVDRQEFRADGERYQLVADQTTLYASHRDWAVWLSKIVHRWARVGYFPPATVVRGVDSIEVRGFDVDLLGHGYFAAAQELIDDMSAAVTSGARPSIAPRRPLEHEQAEGYWRMRP